jgi:mannonate dehydratase
VLEPQLEEKMRLGFGLYRHQLDDSHFAFARQLGATDIVVHYVDYFNQGESCGNLPSNQPTGDARGWGRAGDGQTLWSVQELTDLRRRIEAHGLRFYALENFDPGHWHDVLLAGPRLDEQLAQLKQLVRNVGEAGIPVIGYNFSLAGVYGRQHGPWARGGAVSVGLQSDIREDEAIPQGMVWNMRYRDMLGPGYIAPCTHDELWGRLSVFLRELVPVAEAAGVRLAAHPDDPPLATVRQSPRLVYQPTMYDRLLQLAPSRSNAVELCLGTLAEMTERGDGCAAVYAALEHYVQQGSVAYIHFRNVRGVVPNYVETFVDDGDLDMHRVVQILDRHGYDGVLIPDHTPLLSHGGWYSGMAYAMGYMKALLDRAGSGRKTTAARQQ